MRLLWVKKFISLIGITSFFFPIYSKLSAAEYSQLEENTWTFYQEELWGKALDLANQSKHLKPKPIKKFFLKIGEYNLEKKFRTKENHPKVFLNMTNPQEFTTRKYYSHKSFRRASIVAKKDDLTLETKKIKEKKLFSVEKIAYDVTGTTLGIKQLRPSTATDENSAIISSDRVWKDVAICSYLDNFYYQTQNIFYKAGLSEERMYDTKGGSSTKTVQEWQFATIEHIFQIEENFKILVRTYESPDEFIVLDPKDITEKMIETSVKEFSFNSFD